MKSLLFGLLLLMSFERRAASYEPGIKEVGSFSDSVRKVIDSSIVLLRTYALHRDRPDWDHVRERAYELAGQTGRWEDLGPVAAWLFEAVDDHHGWLSVKDTMFRWERPEPPFLSEALKKEFAKGNRIVRKLLPGGIGYLRVPGMVMDTADYNKYAQRLMDSLCALEAEGARKLIIDLRLNAGGTIFPMIAGLSPLLGNGSFLGNADRKGKILDMTRLENGRFSSADGGVAQALRKGAKHIDAGTPVVVLMGHGTGSAGECVAVAFSGRKHTWFIGEPTAGYTTGNAGHWIVDGRVGIVIAETMVADRDHRCYPHNLVPDEWVPGGDDFEDLSRDLKLQAASRKLQAASCEL
ncbi:S41 family peptidase [Flavitalea sp. BT771]|uniref:S41 family peptidase n=1 Tax=Flavitalea sp. BT771 TaxID=3063329 RepID=UPI0026E2CDED|nr:S41 family peptidase [Flavitalea sp. BT771]MDO6434917.1 S41 family peptidase [Flavitalea sp. BT771]MDV6223817.1 S41 family peptidase [Flavitalea sp. BT771]